MKYRIDVGLKEDVLDPEARAIQDVLAKLGYHAVKKLAIHKSFSVDVAEGTSDPEGMLAELAKRHLANPVSQTFRIQRVEP